MSDWKEHPHLFANGKFRFNHVALKEPNILDVSTLYKILSSNILNECTLIARPVESMTDEELANHLAKNSKPSEYSNGTLKDWMITLIDLANNGEMYRDDFVNLLSIGVLPFPQSLFEDGTVIDSREL